MVDEKAAAVRAAELIAELGFDALLGITGSPVIEQGESK